MGDAFPLRRQLHNHRDLVSAVGDHDALLFDSLDCIAVLIELFDGVNLNHGSGGP